MTSDASPWSHLTAFDGGFLGAVDMTQRRLTATARTLPNFLIIGAQRSGTSSLYHWLVQHPHVLRAKRKEVHYFDFNFDRREQWYRANFPLRFTIRRIGRRGRAATGEATPNYLFDPSVPARVHALLPDVRLVVVLRNPVERAISHYWHAVDEGRETRPLTTAIEADMRAHDDRDEDAWAFSYARRGLYAEQLTRWLDHFQADQMLLLCSEEMFRAPLETVRRVWEFLGVSDMTAVGRPLTDSARNTTTVNRDQDDAEARAGLDRFFEEPNRLLAKLTGRNFPWIDQLEPRIES